MPVRQTTQPDLTDTRAFEANDLQRNGLTHAPDLPFAALPQYHSQQVLIELRDACRFELTSVQAKTVTQPPQDIVADRATDFD